MSDRLDKMESPLEEVEDQLLADLERIRKIQSKEPYVPIDSDLKNTLNKTLMDLWRDLEHGSDESGLTFRSQRHENISARMIVVKKLLDVNLPTVFLVEAQEQIEVSRPAAETPDKEFSQAEVDVEEPTGFLETIMQFFRGKAVPDDVNITEEKESQNLEIYLDSVTAAQHLAAIAKLYQTDGDDTDMMNAAALGKAVFESRELTIRMPEVLQGEAAARAQRPEEIRRKLEQSNRSSGSTAPEQVNQKEDLALTPDAIRKKLEGAAPHTGGASTFKSKELSATIPPMPSDAVKPATEKRAQTPDEIRKKLEARQGDSSSSGKASFSAKDIKHATPREAPPKAEEKPVKEEPAEPPTGKAVFESKDVPSQDKK